MQIQFTVIGDSLDEIAEELRAIAARLAPEDAPPVETPKATARKKPRPEKEPEPETEPATEQVEEGPTEQVEEPTTGDDEQAPGDVAPEEAWQEATDLLLAAWSKKEEARDKIKGLLTEYGVKRFMEIPKEKGPELLAKAKEIVA